MSAWLRARTPGVQHRTQRVVMSRGVTSSRVAYDAVWLAQHMRGADEILRIGFIPTENHELGETLEADATALRGQISEAFLNVLMP